MTVMKMVGSSAVNMKMSRARCKNTVVGDRAFTRPIVTDMRRRRVPTTTVGV